MRTVSAIAFASLSLALVATPAGADPLSSKTTTATEVVTPTAKGPKPYFASFSGECDAGACFHEFGKKAKARTIDIVTCGMSSTGGEGIYGFIYFDGQPRYIVPINSRSEASMVEFSMLAFQYRFTVPEGVRLTLYFYTAGTPESSFCSIEGTLG